MRAFNRRRRVPHLIDKFQNLRRRTERHIHRVDQHVRRQLREFLRLLTEFRRVRALEGIDRLFLVPDYEKRPGVLQALGAHP